MEDLNDVIARLLEEHEDRSAPSQVLAAQIAARDLWRCPIGGHHPEAWHIEVWVQSEHGRGRFTLGKGSVTPRRASTPPAPHESWRRTG